MCTLRGHKRPMMPTKIREILWYLSGGGDLYEEDVSGALEESDTDDDYHIVERCSLIPSSAEVSGEDSDSANDDTDCVRPSTSHATHHPTPPWVWSSDVFTPCAFF